MDSASTSTQGTLTQENQAALIVLNGRLRGTHRLLRFPLTCIGRSHSCDIRLHVDGVSPTHCLIAQSEDRLLLRDLDSKSGTLVNGRRVNHCVLSDGDKIAIGPFQFRLQLPATKETDGDTPEHTVDPAKVEINTTGHEKSALRVQVAAVAAQQAAMMDLEYRLAQRETTLDKQQAQLAAHLEEKRQRLVELYNQTQESRKSLEQDRQSYQKYVDEVSHNLSQSQRELLEDKQQVMTQRQRLVKLRRRLKQRFDDHWTRQQRILEENQTVMADACVFLEQQKELLERERDDLTETCLKLNTDVELGRRQLKDEWNRLHNERAKLQTEVQNWLQTMMQREDELLEAEALLRREKWQCETLSEDTHLELKGLETRIQKQRMLFAEQQKQLQELERELATRTADQSLPAEKQTNSVTPPRIYPLALPMPREYRIEYWLFEKPVRPRKMPLSPAEQMWFEACRELIDMAGDLDDQRRSLIEHWKTFLQIQQTWQREHRAMCAEMVTVIRGLKDNAEKLSTREQQTAEAVAEVQHRHEEMLQLRQHLVGWQGRLQAQETSWEAERDRTLAELRNREALLETQLKEAEELAKRWADRRKEEFDSLQTERQAFVKAHHEYHTLAQQCRQQLLELQEEKQNFSAQAVAVEQYRQQTLALARNPTAADRRIDRLFRRLKKDSTDLLNSFQNENQELQAQLLQLQALYTDAQQKIDDAETEKQVHRKYREDWEKQMLMTDSERQQLHHELQAAQAKQARCEQQIHDLQNEVERIARVLLEEPPPPAVVLNSATGKKARANTPAEQKKNDTNPSSVDRAA